MPPKKQGESQIVTRRAALHTLNNADPHGVENKPVEGVKLKAGRRLPQAKIVLPDPETPIPMEMSIDMSSPTNIAYSARTLPAHITDIDSEDADNPQLVSDYVNEIYAYLWSLEAETKFEINRHYLSNQEEITGKMRAVLVDWLIQIHQRFHLLQETLFLTVYIIDKFLQEKIVKRNKLQLVGVTAMFISCKFEEMYAPDISDFVYITDSAYPKNEILKMEIFMLQNLKFNLARPLPIHFLRRNSKAGNVDTHMHTMAKYLMELTLVDYELVHIAPSKLAAAALYIALELLENTSWSADLEFYSNYTMAEILPVARRMCFLVTNLENSKLKAAFRKYGSSKLLNVSQASELKSSFVQKLALEA